MNKFLKQFVLSALIAIAAFPSHVAAQGNTCAQATPFCTAIGVPFNYPNVSNGSSAPLGPNNPTMSPFYGCICPTTAGLKDPSWFYIKSTAAGAMTYTISQSNGDVDFVCWGPYTSLTNICNQLTGTCASNCSVSHPTCSGGIMDCSYSIAASEVMTINATAPGQYFMVMITNYQGGAGTISFTQGSGPPSDCSITCPGSAGITMEMQTYTNYLAGNSTFAANGSTITCLDDYVIYPYIPAGGDIVEPCIDVEFNPYITSMPTKGILSVSEGTTAIFNFCPSACTDGQLTGASAVAGSNFGLQLYQLDSSASHSFAFCATGSGATTTTVSLRNCWDNSIIYGGPQTWNLNSTSCFTLNMPAGTDIGQAYYTIAPTAVGTATYDTYSGILLFDPTQLVGGTTYTVTYHFKSTDHCGFKTSTFVFTVPTVPVLTTVSSQTACSGGTVPATNFTLTPAAGASVSWVNSNTAIGVAASGTVNIASYTAPTVATSQVGSFTVAPVKAGCVGPAKNFSITINPNPTASASSTQTLNCLTTSAVLTGSGGGTYNWSGPGITGGGTTATPTVNLPGTYIETVTVAGCTATASAIVAQNIATPPVTASVSNTITCTTTTVNAIDSTTATPVSYTWSGPGIVSGGSTGTVVANAGGVYSYTVTNTSNNCKTTGTLSVVQNNAAPSVTGAASASLNCNTSTVNATATTTSTPVSYTWTGPGIVSGGTTSSPVVNAGGTYNYTVTNTANGCKTPGTVAVTQDITTPTVTAAASASLNCTTTTVNVTATTAATPVSYTWTGPGIVSGATSSSAVVNAGGTYNYTVTNTANGCKTMGTVTVLQSAGIPTVTAAASGTLTCSTTTVNATATTTSSPVSYSWSGPGIVSGGTTATITVNAGGTYNYTVTNTATGCKSPGTVSVTQNTATPAVTASASGSLNCTTTTVNATASTTSTPVSYTWTGPGIVSGGTTGSPVVNAGGTYNYTVTNTSNGCKTPGTVAVTQDIATPTVTAAASSSLNCTTTTVNVIATTAATPVSYTWTGPGVVTGASTATVVVNAGGTYNYTVTNTANGCNTSGSATVLQSTGIPAVTATATASLNCTTTTVTAVATTTSTPVTYSWSGPGIVSGGSTATVTVNAGGTYNYTVTNTTTGCKSPGTVSVTQNTVSPAVSGAFTGTLTCATTTVNATASTTTTPVSYNWTGPGVVSGGTTSSPVVNAGGVYSYTVTSTANNCKTPGTVTVPQNTTAITPTLSASSVLTCTNTSSGITALPGAGVTYTWTGVGVTAGANTATATANQPGVYTLSVTNTVNGCVGSQTVAVTQNTVAPTVTVSPTQTITCASPTVTISGSATPATCTPVWTGGVCGSATSYTTSVCSPGTYTLTVTNPVNGCTKAGTVSVVPSVGLPSVTASNSGSLTCTTTTAQVVATTTDTPVSYSWTGPGAVTGAGTASGTVTVGGTYQCVVTNILTGCASTITTNVPVDVAAPSVTIAPTATITCSTPSLVLSVAPSGNPYTISWTGTGLTGNTVATPTVTQGGGFSVVITNTVNGCTGNASVTVPTNTTAPTLTVTPGSYTTSCASPTVQLTASSSDPSVTYSWTAPPTGSLNNTNTQNPVASGTGVFTVVITSTVSGCQSSLSSNSTATVVPNASIPTVSLSANSLSLTCSSATVGATATSTTTPLSYSWSPAPLSGGATNTPVFDTPGTYTLTVMNTSNGCSTFANLTVGTNTTAPTVTISPVQVLTCSTPSVTISTTVTPAGVTYSWTGPGITLPSTGSSVTANQAATYSVLVTDAVNGCTNTANSTVTGNTVSPTATITPVSTSSVISCSSPTLGLAIATTPTTGVTYTWSAGGATTPTITASGAGIVTATVVNAASGCSITVQYTVTGNTTQPSVNVATNASIPCGATSTTINASSTNTNVSYSWTGPNAGSITSGSNTSTPSIADPGTYTVTATDASNGCSTQSVVTVAQTSVTAAFTADPTSGVSPLVVNFSNQSAGATGYSWTFGDGNNSTATNPSNTYNGSTTYTVMLVASAGPCTDTAYATIVIESGLTLEIPNVFTPNDDSINDVFTIKSTGVKEISLQIFNRWGQKMFEFTGPKAGWDGKTGDGGKVPDGTYFYFIKATGFDGKSIEKQGTVNLYR